MPDLKKMLTLEALSEALPSWLKRSTKPEYNADEIDSTLTTNQFVTASDKDNWNAKGTYSKPSGGIPKSDLSSIVQTSLEKADSALQSETDPTVPSWAKQTNKPSYTQDEVADGTTYKRVTQTEKDTWSGKQNALTTTQMQAVNSGITSAGVTQISTNQTNILYGINNGVKNICDYVNPLQLNNCEIVDGEFKQIVTDSKANLQFMASSVRSDGTTYALFTSVTITANGEYSYEFNFPSDAVAIRIGHNGTTRDAKFDINTDHFVVGTTYVISINVLNCVQSSGVYRFNKIMICTKQLWDTIGHDFQPPALPNSDLTVLEAEDRASLAEVVDSGAKNLFQFPTLDALKAINTTGTWNGSAYTRDGVTFTVSNNTIAVSGSIAAGVNTSIIVRNNISPSEFAKYTGGILSGGKSDLVHVSIEQNGSPWRIKADDTGNGSVISAAVSGESEYMMVLRVTNTTSSAKTISSTSIAIMICTLADWKVSQRYVAYNTMAQWTKVEKEYTSTAADTMEYSGVSFTVPAGQIYEFIAMDKYSAGRPSGIGIADNSTNYATNSTIIAENIVEQSVANVALWARQVSGMTVLQDSNTTYYVWVKRVSASKSKVYLMYRRIL